MTRITDLETRLRLAAGYTPLWRGPDSVQLGIDPRHALVIADLSPGLAEVVRRLDGRHDTSALLTAAGAERGAAVELIEQLLDARIVEPADQAERTPPALLPDAATWGLRTGRTPCELLERRYGATVAVHGDGRIAIGVATLLAAAAVGAVVVHTTGRVTGADVGTGYLREDIGRDRQQAAADAVARARSLRSSASPEVPDVVVLTDAAVWDPNLTLRLAVERVPHLAVHGREASVVVGPLVLPSRTSCLRCTDLHRTDRDPCWPQVAAQLATRPPEVELACAQIAAGMAVEQVLAMLTGRGELPDAPPSIETTFELDPLHGALTRRRWPPHPRCGCGAVPDPRPHPTRTPNTHD